MSWWDYFKGRGVAYDLFWLGVSVVVLIVGIGVIVIADGVQRRKRRRR